MKSLRIQTFKAIGDATLHWHPRVNVLTGPNNSGKTTVLEALALWVEAFDRLIGRAGKTLRTRGAQRGDWYLTDQALVHHSEVVSIRSPGFDDPFNGEAKELRISAVLEDGEGAFEIPFKVTKARGAHYEFSCPKESTRTINPRLKISCEHMPHPFRVLFASPVAAVQINEEFLTPGKTKDMIRRRRSAEVLRNRIYRLYGRPEFQRFLDDVSAVLTGGLGGLEIEAHGQPNDDVHTRVLARISKRDRLRDISLLGSGSLQVIEVLLNLYLETSDLNIVLLDEPDSHIHRDIQRRLLDVIERKADSAQIFITTHNESLLRNVGWDRVFHLESAPVESPREFHAIASERVVAKGRQLGLLASPLRGALTSVGAESALDLLSALEAKHFLLVEGPSDAMVFDRMFEVERLGRAAETAMYWSMGGFDRGLRALPALEILLEGIQNQRSLWSKAQLILDRDLFTPKQANRLAVALHTKFGVTVHLWSARTVEATLLSGGPSVAFARAVTAAGRRAGLPGLDESQAHTACQTAWNALGERLRADWEKPKMERLHHELNQRKSLLVQLGMPKVLPDSIGSLQDEIIAFHQGAVSRADYSASAEKNDVRRCVIETLQAMGVDPEITENWAGPSWFHALVNEVGRGSDYPALATMHSALRQDG